MNIIITGGIGFIGTNTAIHFAKNTKNKIIIVDNFSRIGVNRNAEFLKNNFSNIKIIKCNVNDIKQYMSSLIKSDVIIHLAGQTAVTTSVANPLLDYKNNLNAGFTLLEAVRNYNLKATLLYSSTNKVYGDLKKIKYDKTKGLSENIPLNFISPYGCSKGAIDQYFLDYARIYGLKTVVFRQSCIYGPFQIGVEDQGWVAHFTKQFLLKRPVTIFGNGKQVRDLLFVDDLIEAYDLAIKNITKIKGQVFNIGGGIDNSYSLLEVINLLEKLTANKIKIEFDKTRLGDQDYFVSDNKKVGKLLGWKPKTKFKYGLKKLIKWQNENFIF